MKTIDDALELRRRIFGAFEMAESAADAERARQWLTIVVVGAGPTGVELAARSASSRCAACGTTSAPSTPRRCACCCSTAARNRSRRSATTSPAQAAKELETLGVELRMGARVTGVDAFGVDVADERRHRAASTARTVDLGRRRAGVTARRDARRRDAAPRSTGPAASRRCPISRCPVIPRCSRSATW